MRRLFPAFIILILAMSMAGCASQEVPQNDDIPRATITKAAFELGHPFTVIVTGNFFKIKSDNKLDVVCSINARNWVAAKSILSGSPTSYTADLPFGVNYPQVWVRVMGVNGDYSELTLVQGQQ